MTNLPIHPELGDNFNYQAALDELQNALTGMHAAPAASEIAQAAIQVGALLLRKNAAYGDAALSPVEVFSRGIPTSVRLGIRMDDKISRLAKGNADGEDPEMDLVGYLLLKKIALAREAAEQPKAKPASIPQVQVGTSIPFGTIPLAALQPTSPPPSSPPPSAPPKDPTVVEDETAPFPPIGASNA
jgi:hypothetical protein